MIAILPFFKQRPRPEPSRQILINQQQISINDAQLEINALTRQQLCSIMDAVVKVRERLDRLEAK